MAFSSPAEETVVSGWDDQAVAPMAAPAEASELTAPEDTSTTWTSGAADSWPPPTDALSLRPRRASQSLNQMRMPNSSRRHLRRYRRQPRRDGGGDGASYGLLDELRQTISEIDPQVPSISAGSSLTWKSRCIPRERWRSTPLPSCGMGCSPRGSDHAISTRLSTSPNGSMRCCSGDIAYDRTIAAIERSLDVLRADGADMFAALTVINSLRSW